MNPALRADALPDTLDIAIVGAGAAGLMAAIFAARTAPGWRVVALDGAKRVGAKILVSGGGRCNVTHDVIHFEDFNATNRNQLAKVLRSFDVPQTVEFFRELGITLKREETGKLFPATDNARSVLNALLGALRGAGAELREDCRVLQVERSEDGFALQTSQGPLRARRLVLATGGKSLPRTGSDGAGYEFARTLGHSVTHTWPALVPLVLTPGHWLASLSGVSLDVELSLAAGSGRVLHRQRGAMLLTHFGISGPAPMDISRHWIAAHEADPDATLLANLTPDADLAQVEAHLLAEAQQRPRAGVTTVLRRWLPERLAQALVEHAAEFPPDQTLGQLRKEQRRVLARALVALPLPVQRDRGFLFAEVTAGGVPLTEVETATMASRRCPGLFLCGEILDVDGRIGGYNFQWAWASGRLAGAAAART